MLQFKNKPVFIFSATMILLLSVSCKKNSSNTTTTTTTTSNHGTGLTSKDDPATVPQAVNISSLAGTTSLPSKVDLSPFCPPVGDQGQTETCVGWSTGYYAKTVSEAIANNYTQAKLVSGAYQLSAKDMFLEIPDAQKGADCQSGTQITSAMDILVSTGVATVATVPWDPNITNCSQSQVQNSWTAEAGNHKISYYRTISSTVQGIKEQLAANNPVVMAIKVSNEFQAYRGGIITSATFPAQVGLHAQCIVGYDDNQGTAGAFRVINSWGTSWGDNGYYWIDYNTLVNQYIYGGNVYYMSSSNANTTTVTPPTTTTTSSVDIAAWVFSDVPTNTQSARKMYLNIYNIGQDDVNPSSNWSLYYLYYNAYDANDYGIIFHDEFSNTNANAPANNYYCANNDACVYNLTIPAGSNFAEAGFGTTEIYRNYDVPDISGSYYLVLVADPQNVLADVNEQNNIFYTTGQLPATFTNGYTNSYNPAQGGIHDSVKNNLLANESNLRFSRFNTSVNELNRNAYTPQEIISFVKAKYKSGEIRRKINAMKNAQKTKLPQVN